MNAESIAGCLLGTAVGDALGLPYEGLSPQRARRLLGDPIRFRFLFGRGMVSDDTEHACFTWQALLDSQNEDQRFARSLAWHLRAWFLRLPPGIGLATARACMKLVLGWGPRTSGVYSAGNGPAMRAPILGAAIDDLDQLRLFVRTATRVTHTDPLAEQAAFAIALAAWTSRREPVPKPAPFFAHVRSLLGAEMSPEMQLSLAATESSLLKGQSTTAFAETLCGPRGVSGYALQTVPVVLHAWLCHPHDYRAAVTSVIQCGGDADSTAAMVGGIVGTKVGEQGIPNEWLDRMVEWPLSVSELRRVAYLSQADSRANPIGRLVSHFAVLLRNLLFLGVVLVHGFRRLFPPF